MSQATDEAGRDRRFAEWTTAHAAIFFRVANAFARGADRDDLMQELLLAAWKAIPAFQGRALPSTFLYRVTHNAALAWKRGERSRRNLAERYERLRVPALGEPGHWAAEPGTDQEKLHRLYAGIRELPALDRSLVLLWLDDVPYAEIAAIHGLSVSNVGVRLTRARQALAQELQGEA